MSEKNELLKKREYVNDIWSQTELHIISKTKGTISTLNDEIDLGEIGEYEIKDNTITVWASKEHFIESDYEDIANYIIENHIEELGLNEDEVDVIIKPFAENY